MSDETGGGEARGGGKGGIGVGGGNFRGSWAEMLGSTLPSSWNKNVLQIVLEKDIRGAFMVSNHDCARVMKKIGLDQRPGVQVDSVQICPNGRGRILITLKDSVAIENFCRYDIFEVTESGIRTVNVKPAGKRDAVVIVKGLHLNTKDQWVMDYLGKFGKLVTSKVIYHTFGDGPLHGLKNGDRSYKVELKPNVNIGTYHVLDGNKVTLRYPGQQQTCARCHETPQNCRGGGMARRCEAAGGLRVEFSEYIMGLWNKIGYVPGELEVAAVFDDHGEDTVQEISVHLQAGGHFTPVKVTSDPDLFKGVTIKQFPKDTDHGAIMEFLAIAGLPEASKESVVIKSNGTVTIRDLDNAVCKSLIENIHSKKKFDRKLFCNGIIPRTPDKPANDSPPAVTAPHQKTSSTSSPVLPPPISPISSSSSPSKLQDIGPYSIIPDTPDINMKMTDIQLVERHSLSLKTPPLGSLADDILRSSHPQTQRIQ